MNDDERHDFNPNKCFECHERTARIGEDGMREIFWCLWCGTIAKVHRVMRGDVFVVRPHRVCK